MSERGERPTSADEPEPNAAQAGTEETVRPESGADDRSSTAEQAGAAAENGTAERPVPAETSGPTEQSGTVEAPEQSGVADRSGATGRPGSGSVGDRYGRAPRSSRRWVLPVLSVGVVVLGLIIAYIGYKQFGPKDIDPEQLGYTVINDSTIEAHFKVTRTHPEQATVCFVRAMDSNGSEVGRREVLITPSSSGTVELKTIVRSVARPAATDIYGCGGKVPAYLRAG
ncbi:DUF4307 domain-containing protein [Nocardia miyunensis]|uniref:DUF4307 domain-containing protein n=1 Tax=Nocardia miyunensis TaxID=282684 RepID=UPI000B1D97F2|nr:DUF4307 domain-containing protein [Nocardia miyunensis]